MKVKLTVTVGDFERYVVAKYFQLPGEKRKTRATRAQIKRFMQAALRTAVREQMEMLPSRAKAKAKRMSVPKDNVPVEVLVEPREKQGSLTW